MKFLLDTNVIAEPTKPTPNRGLLRRIDQHTGQTAIASPTWHELVFGVERLPEGRRKRLLREYLEDAVRATLPILDYDTRAAEWHARERARHGARGRAVPFVDGQIAAIAAVHDLTLVTANVRDFAAFEGVHVENWMR